MTIQPNGDTAASRMSLAAALRQVMTQLVRLLEEEDPSNLLRNGSAFLTALEGWRKTVSAQTSGVSVQRARELERAKLESMGQAAKLQKERDDLESRNKELLNELVKQKKKEVDYKQQVLDAQFSGTGHRAEAQALDLEVRELRRRVRELEGGPPLSAKEAAPASKQDGTPTASAQPEPGALASAPSVQDRRAAAEAAFTAMWKPKPPSPGGDALAQQGVDQAARLRSTQKHKKKKTSQARAGKKADAKRSAAKKPGAPPKAPAANASANKALGKKAPAKKAPAKKAPARKAPARKAPASKAPARKAPARKAPARKAPAKKAPAEQALGKKAPGKKAPGKKAPAKKAPAKKAPGKKAPGKKAPGKKAPAKQAPGKQAPARKAATRTRPAAKKAATVSAKG